MHSHHSLNFTNIQYIIQYIQYNIYNQYIKYINISIYQYIYQLLKSLLGKEPKVSSVSDFRDVSCRLLAALDLPAASAALDSAMSAANFSSWPTMACFLAGQCLPWQPSHMEDWPSATASNSSKWGRRCSARLGLASSSMITHPPCIGRMSSPVKMPVHTSIGQTCDHSAALLRFFGIVFCSTSDMVGLTGPTTRLLKHLEFPTLVCIVGWQSRSMAVSSGKTFPTKTK